MDDYLPCIGDEPAFSKGHGGELWVLLLEKAWAKVHGSYDRIQEGGSAEPMRDLTGAPCYSYMIKDEPDVFDKVVEGHFKKYLICVNIDE